MARRRFKPRKYTTMPHLPALPESEASDKAQQTYGRLKEALGTDVLPDVFLQMGRVPAFLHDFYMNFKKYVLGEGRLSSKERMLVALGASLNAGSDEWTDLLRGFAGESVSDEEYAELAAVVSACNMYNTFFKFRALAGSDVFEGMSVGLRAHVFSGTSLDDKIVELVNTAVSNINGCKPCTEGHVAKCRQLGIPDEAILEAIQCAAVMQAGTKYTQAAGR